MTRIAPVRLLYNPKTLWFDARDLELSCGQPVVVLTARGTELGYVAEDVFEATDDQVKKLKSALKPVKRLATDEDVERAEEMKQRSVDALPVFKEMAAEANADMRPVSVEFLLDGDKAVFYFEAEERVDFRDLVRKLASHFRVRIDMRQIGVRDEARMVGGLGHCGQELCCKRLGGEFCPVSIRMAKEQDLSLNPQKISGVCGRLMCCLRYEFDAYKDFKSRAPKQNAMINTPDGPAKVASLDVPREVVQLRTEEGKTVKVPLADFDPPAEGARPTSVGVEAWDAAMAAAGLGSAAEVAFLTSQFTGNDKLGTAKAVRRGTGGKGAQKKSASQGKGDQGGRGSRAAQAQPLDGNAGRKPRRRRSTKVSTAQADGSQAAQTAQPAQAAAGQKQGEQKQAKKKGMQPRRKNSQQNKKQTQRPDAKKQAAAAGSGGNAAASQDGRKPRPGQKSSGLRQGRNAGKQAAAADKQRKRPEGDGARGGQGSQGSQGGNQASQSAGQGHRKPRRRTHRAGSQAQGGEGAKAQGGSPKGGQGNRPQGSQGGGRNERGSRSSQGGSSSGPASKE